MVGYLHEPINLYYPKFFFYKVDFTYITIKFDKYAIFPSENLSVKFAWNN